MWRKLRRRVGENKQKRDSTEDISVMERISKRNRKGIRILEPGKFPLVESGILGFGIRNTAQGIRNPTNDWNPDSKFHWERLGSSSWNPESTAWNPESKTVLDSLARGGTNKSQNNKLITDIQDSEWEQVVTACFLFLGN